MNRSIIFCFFSLLLFSCDSTSKDPNPFHMRSHEPVIVDAPTSITNDYTDFAYFIITLSGNKIVVSNFGKSISLSKWQQLDSLLEITPADKLKAHLVLKADSSATYQRIDSGISLLKKHNLTQFSLITDLEKAP
ncbi:MAG: hypothetical protein M3R17_02070 [Bacteroidota bacterium]|nr:hypothetical protein [Bacteroidota bacterium]